MGYSITCMPSQLQEHACHRWGAAGPTHAELWPTAGADLGHQAPEQSWCEAHRLCVLAVAGEGSAVVKLVSCLFSVLCRPHV